jgi:diguanylate cyclase (GGDEF)-like protein
MALINIDRFREINQLFGNDSGDSVIAALGKRLKAFCREAGVALYRLRGDEFAVLIFGENTERDLLSLVDRLHSFCENEHFLIRGQTIEILVTLGVALGKDRICQKADDALRQAKKKNKKVLFVSKALDQDKQLENLNWVRTLRATIHQEGVLAYFQPILNVFTGRIEKYETLIRLRDVSGKIILPGAFLGISKKAKLYHALSKEMATQAFKIAETSGGEFSINLGADDILDEETVKVVLDKLRGSPAAHRIVFEVLESESIESYDRVRAFIDEVKTLGAKIAIDDFGTGYSNFEHLIRLNVDYIKIDGSLIKNVDTDRHSKILVENIVDFSNKLGILTIAEYVHSQSVLEVVKALGVHYVQGFYIGEPKPYLLP